MINISSFVLCESITSLQLPNGMTVPQLNTPQLVLRPFYIPGVFSFSFMLGLSGIDFSVENRLKMQILSPHGVLVQDFAEGPLLGMFNDPNIPIQINGCIINIDVRNMLVQEQGQYNLKVFVNNNFIGEKIIPVYQMTMVNI